MLKYLFIDLLIITNVLCKLALRANNKPVVENPSLIYVEINAIDSRLDLLQKQINDALNSVEEAKVLFANKTDPPKLLRDSPIYRTRQLRLPSNHSHLDPRHPNDLGYFSNAVQYLLEMMVNKDPQHVKQVIKHAKPVFNNMTSHGHFSWLDDSLMKVVRNFITALSDLPFEQIRGAVKLFHDDMKERHFEYLPEVNKIIDSANKLIDEVDGDHLLNMIIEFEVYPEGYKTAKPLCYAMLEAFDRLFKKAQHTEEFNNFIKLANQALKRRYPIINRSNLRREENPKNPPEKKDPSEAVDPPATELDPDLETRKEVIERYLQREQLLLHVDNFLRGIQTDMAIGTSIAALCQNEIKKYNLTCENLHDKHTIQISDEEDIEINLEEEYLIANKGVLDDLWVEILTEITLKNATSYKVLKHARPAAETLLNHTETIGPAIQTAVLEIASYFSELTFDDIKACSVPMYDAILDRANAYSPEINRILDFGNDFYTNYYATKVYTALREFEKYPVNDTLNFKSGSDICNEVMKALAQPFAKENIKIDRLNEMLVAANKTKTIQARVSQIFRNKKRKRPEVKKPEDQKPEDKKPRRAFFMDNKVNTRFRVMDAKGTLYKKFNRPTQQKGNTKRLFPAKAFRNKRYPLM